MPTYYFHCDGCSASKSVIRKPAKANDPLACDTCGQQMRRNPRGPTSKIVETLDNGIMTRRVERPADAERLNWERSQMSEPRDP